MLLVIKCNAISNYFTLKMSILYFLCVRAFGEYVIMYMYAWLCTTVCMLTCLCNAGVGLKRKIR